MRIVIFGGAGFIGSKVAYFLKLASHDVVSVDNYSTGSTANHISGVEYINMDITDTKSMLSFSHDTDLVIHLAFPTSMCDRNPYNQFESVAATGMINVLEFTKRTCNKIIYGSSISVYGEEKDTVITENTAIKPLLLYGANKYLNELYIKSYNYLHKTQYNILRISDVFGENDSRRNAIYKFKEALINNQNITINGDGAQVRTFSYIDDISFGITKTTINLTNDVYNIASSTSTSILDLCTELQRIIGKVVPISFDTVSKDSRNYVFNCKKFIRTFGVFENVGFYSGLEKYVNNNTL